MRTQDHQLAGAVDAGGVEQLAGKLQEELTEDEHGGWADGERQDHPEIGVAQPVVADEQHVQRDHQQLERDRLHEQHAGERGAPAAVMEHGHGVAGEQPEEDRAEQHADRDDRRVAQRADQVDGLVDVAVVGGREIARPRHRAADAAVDLLLERADEHVPEREDEDEGADRQQQESSDTALAGCRDVIAAGVDGRVVRGHHEFRSLRYRAIEPDRPDEEDEDDADGGGFAGVALLDAASGT